MDFAFVVRQRLEQLGIGQRQLASAAEVTESYISQLLSRKKLPPLPNRTDLYDKMSVVLGLPWEELARLAALAHHQALDQKWQEPAPARFSSMHELVLRKCRPRRQTKMKTIFQKFGQIEPLITRTLLDVARGEARMHAGDESWVRSIAKRGRKSYREMRVRVIELLDSNASAPLDDFSTFVDLVVASWDYDVDHFVLEVELADGAIRRFGFREQTEAQPGMEEPGLRAFLRDARLSSGATPEEVDVLRHIRFPTAGKPTALFYYRMLQSLRDPLNFRPIRKISR